MGDVTNVVKRYVPGSYEALASVSNKYFGGVTELQALANFVKFRVFSTNVSPSQEGTVYDLKEVQLLGILTTLQFIPAAIDYYGTTQLSSESLQDPSESRSYRDPRPELWNLFERLVEEAKSLGSELGIGVLGAKGVIPKVSYGDNGRGILISPDPLDFEEEYPSRTVSDLIPWGVPWN